MLNRFVILALPRSGSSLLHSLLNSHPDIACHGEILKRNAAAGHLLRSWRDQVDWSQRLKDPVAFIESVFAYDQPSDNVGFKLFRTHMSDPVIETLKSSQYKKIILERRNRFACYSSKKLAHKTGIFNTRKGKVANSISDNIIDFSREEFLHFRKSYGKAMRFYRREFGSDAINVYYDRIAAGKGIRPALRFLGVEPQKLSSKLRQLHSKNILDRFQPSDHDAIRKTLDEIGHPEWINE